MLPVAYDPLLVLASVLVAIMAAFTGLRLASGLSQLDPADRRPRIAQAADRRYSADVWADLKRSAIRASYSHFV